MFLPPLLCPYCRLDHPFEKPGVLDKCKREFDAKRTEEAVDRAWELNR
jgi:hypothetical protein